MNRKERRLAARLDGAAGEAERLYGQGNMAAGLGRMEEAVRLYRQALRADARHLGARNNLGNALSALGRLDEAAASFRRTLEQKPDFAEGFNNLGIALAGLEAGNRAKPEAGAAYKAALLLSPGFAEAWGNLGNHHRQERRIAESLACHARAVCLAPANPRLLGNQGHAYREAGRPAEAEQSHRRALALAPNDGDNRNALAACLQEQGRLDQAIALWNDLLAAQPGHAGARWNRALALLLAGDYEKGFAEFEWRWRGGVPGLAPRRMAVPEWSGEDLAGKRLLLYADQGLGDCLQFLRFVPMLAERGAEVILEVPAGLVRLLAAQPTLSEVIVAGRRPPAVDYHLPLMSAAHRLGIRLATIPRQTPYLAADPALAALWRDRLADRPGLKIGLAWAGNPAFARDRQRSLAFAELAPLLSIEGVAPVSLQLGEAGRVPGTGSGLFEAGPWLTDFAETAALIETLDLVISVDTAVAHLAGALGKPVWILLPFAPDWRWRSEGESAPWYPTARLFRQDRPGDWSAPLARMADALSGLARPT